MNREDMKALLAQGLVRIRFQKKDNTIREMRCTTHTSIMPPPPPPNPLKPARKLADHLILVWDVESEALRSFDPDTLLEEPVLLEDYRK